MDRTTYAVDLAKNLMQLHWVDAETGEIPRKKASRAKLAEYFAALKPVRIVMEVCGSAHHRARVLGAQGHEVELLPPGQASPLCGATKTTQPTRKRSGSQGSKTISAGYRSRAASSRR